MQARHRVSATSHRLCSQQSLDANGLPLEDMYRHKVHEILLRTNKCLMKKLPSAVFITSR